MNILRKGKPSNALVAAQGDTLQTLRDRNMMLLGWTTLPFLIPFFILNIVQHRIYVSLLTALITLIAMSNSIAIKTKNIVLVPSWIFFAIVHLSVVYSVIKIGMPALFWCYPVFFVVFFVTERSRARKFITVSFLVFLTVVLKQFEPVLALRFMFTLFILCYFSDLLVGTLIRLQEKMSELAIRDPLTNAYNRRFMNTCLDNIIEETRRDLGPASLILLDVDHFKQINDELGHVAGDQVVKNLVDLLNQRKRKIDYVFRVGGEEFVVLLKNADLQQAVMVAENLRQTVEESELFQGRKVTISLGVAQYQNDETDDQWLQRADEELYEAKRAGRNCVRSVIDKGAN